MKAFLLGIVAGGIVVCLFMLIVSSLREYLLYSLLVLPVLLTVVFGGTLALIEGLTWKDCKKLRKKMFSKQSNAKKMLKK